MRVSDSAKTRKFKHGMTEILTQNKKILKNFQLKSNPMEIAEIRNFTEVDKTKNVTMHLAKIR